MESFWADFGVMGEMMGGANEMNARKQLKKKVKTK